MSSIQKGPPASPFRLRQSSAPQDDAPPHMTQVGASSSSTQPTTLSGMGASSGSASALTTGVSGTNANDAWFPPKARPIAKNGQRKVILGVCAMDAKTKSDPMTQILDRLRAYGEFEVVIFGNATILDLPVHDWPICDCLICFASTGFPLEKAIRYVKLRNPFCINDLPSQFVLLNRKMVYDVLEHYKIPTPRHHYVIRDEDALPAIPPAYVTPVLTSVVSAHQQQLMLKHQQQLVNNKQLGSTLNSNSAHITERHPVAGSAAAFQSPNVSLNPPTSAVTTTQANPSVIGPERKCFGYFQTQFLSFIPPSFLAPLPGSSTSTVFPSLLTSPEESVASGEANTVFIESVQIEGKTANEFPGKEKEKLIRSSLLDVALAPSSDASMEVTSLPGGGSVAREGPDSDGVVTTTLSGGGAGAMSQTRSWPDGRKETRIKSALGAQQLLEQTPQHISIDGKQLMKPLIEKPIDAENHSVYVYYGDQNGGGSRRLFRKIGNRSSRFYPKIDALRTRGNYVYEEMLKNGKDLKVYTIGPGYAHGETRKSPVVDGIVERDPDGKEVRLASKLTHEEKIIAAKVVVAFKQNICGFDMIRWRGKSYVIDVNGWSFVKGNLRYYDKCARILRKMCLTCKQGRRAMGIRVQTMLPHFLKQPSPPPQIQMQASLAIALSLPSASNLISNSLLPQNDLPPTLSEFPISSFTAESILSPAPATTAPASTPVSTDEGVTSAPLTDLENGMVLRSVVAVFRHADRTPKQKVKVRVDEALLLQLFAQPDPKAALEALHLQTCSTSSFGPNMPTSSQHVHFESNSNPSSTTALSAAAPAPITSATTETFANDNSVKFSHIDESKLQIPLGKTMKSSASFECIPSSVGEMDLDDKTVDTKDGKKGVSDLEQDDVRSLHEAFGVLGDEEGLNAEGNKSDKGDEDDLVLVDDLDPTESPTNAGLPKSTNGLKDCTMAYSETVTKASQEDPCFGSLAGEEERSVVDSLHKVLLEEDDDHDQPGLHITDDEEENMSSPEGGHFPFSHRHTNESLKVDESLNGDGVESASDASDAGPRNNDGLKFPQLRHHSSFPNISALLAHGSEPEVNGSKKKDLEAVNHGYHRNNHSHNHSHHKHNHQHHDDINSGRNSSEKSCSQVPSESRVVFKDIVDSRTRESAKTHLKSKSVSHQDMETAQQLGRIHSEDGTNSLCEVERDEKSAFERISSDSDVQQNQSQKIVEPIRIESVPSGSSYRSLQFLDGPQLEGGLKSQEDALTEKPWLQSSQIKSEGDQFGVVSKQVAPDSQMTSESGLTQTPLPQRLNSTMTMPSGTDHEQRIRIVHHWEKHVKEIKMKKSSDLDNLLRLVREVIAKNQTLKAELQQKLLAATSQLNDLNVSQKGRDFTVTPQPPSSPTMGLSPPMHSNTAPLIETASPLPSRNPSYTSTPKLLNLSLDTTGLPSKGVLASSIPELREGVISELGIDHETSVTTCGATGTRSRAVSTTSFDDSIHSPCPTPYLALDQKAPSALQGSVAKVTTIFSLKSIDSQTSTEGRSSEIENPIVESTGTTGNQIITHPTLKALQPSLSNQALQLKTELTQTCARYEKQLKELETGLSKYRQVETVLLMRPEGCKLQLKPRKITYQGRVRQALLVCKWGGGMTHAGHLQAMQYANAFWNDICPPPVPLPEFVTSLAIDRTGVLVKAEGGLYDGGSDDETESMAGGTSSSTMSQSSSSSHAAGIPLGTLQMISYSEAKESKITNFDLHERGRALPAIDITSVESPRSSSPLVPRTPGRSEAQKNSNKFTTQTPQNSGKSVAVDFHQFTESVRDPVNLISRTLTRDFCPVESNVDEALKASFYAAELNTGGTVSERLPGVNDEIPTDAETDVRLDDEQKDHDIPPSRAPSIEAPSEAELISNRSLDHLSEDDDIRSGLESKVYDNPADTQDHTLAVAATERAAKGKMSLYEDYFNAQLAVSLSEPLASQDENDGSYLERNALEHEDFDEDFNEDEDEDCESGSQSNNHSISAESDTDISGNVIAECKEVPDEENRVTATEKLTVASKTNKIRSKRRAQNRRKRKSGSKTDAFVHSEDTHDDNGAEADDDDDEDEEDDDDDDVTKAHEMLTDAHPDLEAPLAYAAYDVDATIGQHEGEQLRSYFAIRRRNKESAARDAMDKTYPELSSFINGEGSQFVDESSIKTSRGSHIHPSVSYNLDAFASNAANVSHRDPVADEIRIPPLLPISKSGIINQVESGIKDSDFGKVLYPLAGSAPTTNGGGPLSHSASNVTLPPNSTVIDPEDATQGFGVVQNTNSSGGSQLRNLFAPLDTTQSEGNVLTGGLASGAISNTFDATPIPRISQPPKTSVISHLPLSVTTLPNFAGIPISQFMADDKSSVTPDTGEVSGRGSSTSSSGNALALTRSSSGVSLRERDSVRPTSGAVVQSAASGDQSGTSRRKWNRKWNQQHMDNLQGLFEHQRLNFIKDMEVFASDEPRVQASARAFYIATFEHAYRLSPSSKRSAEEQSLMRLIRKRADEKCHVSADVLSYLDDISAAARDMHRSKQGVKSMLLSTVRWTEEQVSKYMIYLEKISKAVTEEEKAQLRKEKDAHLREAQLLNERMRLEKEEEEKQKQKEEEELERAARELDEKAAEEEEQAIMVADTAEAEAKAAKKARKKNKAAKAMLEANNSTNSTPSTTPSQSQMGSPDELPPELRMTSWAARCLRWLGIPREQLVKLLDLMRGLLDRIRLLRKRRASAVARREGTLHVTSASSSSSLEMNELPLNDAPPTPSENDEGDEYVFEDGDEEVVGQGAKIRAPAGKTEAEQFIEPCHGETLELLEARWAKLVNDFYDVSRDVFDPTKIPDVYDAVKYDALHNYSLLHGIRPLYQASRKLADFVVPNEYGILGKDKLRIGRLITHKLLDKIVENLDRAKSDSTDIPRVFLYFSSESHIHGLRNTMLLSDMPDNRTAATTLEALELNYLSHGVWRLFEDLSQPHDSPDRFVVNFMFSAGAALDPFIFAEEDHLLPVSRPIPITARIPFEEFKRRFYHLGEKLAAEDIKTSTLCSNSSAVSSNIVGMTPAPSPVVPSPAAMPLDAPSSNSSSLAEVVSMAIDSNQGNSTIIPTPESITSMDSSTFVPYL